MCEGKQGYQGGGTACPVLCISSGCQLHPAWHKEDVLVRAMQLLRFSAGHVMAGIWCSYIWGGKDGKDAEWRQQLLQDTSFHPCCKTLSQHDSHLSWVQASQ